MEKYSKYTDSFGWISSHLQQLVEEKIRQPQYVKNTALSSNQEARITVYKGDVESYRSTRSGMLQTWSCADTLDLD